MIMTTKIWVSNKWQKNGISAKTEIKLKLSTESTDNRDNKVIVT